MKLSSDVVQIESKTDDLYLSERFYLYKYHKNKDILKFV